VRRAGVLEGVRRLILVPDGPLTYLPFAALRDPATGRWLAEAYTIATTPAAAAVVALRAIPPEPPSRSRSSIFAPRTRALPGTDAEALEIARVMPGATIFRDSRATEPALGQALARDRVVHLATHAELNPRNPLFSRIELAAVARAGAPGDGRLDVHEILGLRIRSRLVFLSGCETALGTDATGFVPGEDYATLARAFHYAGAREVVATLWRVEDRGAAEFAARFYQHYEAVGSAEALARAQREMMAGGRYRSPYYWAGYVLSGERGRPDSRKGGPVSVR
jgi:CHAT domain-containing protein